MDCAEQVRVPFVPSAARTARYRLSSFLTEQHLAQPVVDDALVVVSELVTNAVRHATPQDDGELGVSWALERGDLVIAVEDGGSNQRPQVMAANVSAEAGRGLSIVSVLTRRWWVEPRGHGVRVSALLDAG
ncbi:MAG: ATP-binding protein [Nocardioidaceae bacterium]|nr:ATP-binding protein [Nocardioidaceae bacterium]